MATIPTHISMVRTMIREHTDDSRFSDQLIVHTLNTAKATLLSRRLSRWWRTSEWNIKRFCIGLQIEKSHVCECVKVGCDVLKSVYEIPEPIVYRNKQAIRVYDLDGDELEMVTEKEQKTNILDPVKANVPSYSIINNRLVIWNTLELRAVQVEGIWFDETEWEGIQLCDKNGNEIGPCFDLDTTDYGLDPDLHMMAYQMVLELLGVAIRLPEDRTNDSSSDIKQ